MVRNDVEAGRHKAQANDFNGLTPKRSHLIGRKDAYIPMNMYLDGDGAAAELAHWKAVAERRRERGRKYADEMEHNSRGYDVNITLGDGSST